MQRVFSCTASVSCTLSVLLHGERPLTVTLIPSLLTVTEGRDLRQEEFVTLEFVRLLPIVALNKAGVLAVGACSWDSAQSSNKPEAEGAWNPEVPSL